ncbi:MAG: DUF2075 domain-containing protein [Sulfurovum sp.]|nr:DUF2075 domain-containing protein [Sulfurovum sp.]
MSAKDEEYVSTTMLAKSIQLKGSDLVELLHDKGWTKQEGKHRLLTDKGIEVGGKYMSNNKGDKWPVWPLSIVESASFKTEILGELKQVKRKFKLPGVDDLNKDQDRVLRLPEDGQFLIVGGPGTGKSVVALLRTMKYHKNNDYAFLTFNKVLLTATKQLVDFNLNSFTLDKWFSQEYKNIFNEPLYKYDANNNAYQKPNYLEIIKKFESKEVVPQSFHIIIDEGQDKPTKYYEALMYFGIVNFFVVADQNQQITEDNSSRQELTGLLGLEVNDVIELKENYRNSYPIGLLSNSFFTDPSSPPPILPSQSKSSLGTPILYEHNNDQDCVKLILREADRDSRNLIGVIVANDDLRDTYASALKTMEINLDNPRPIISTYSAKDKKVPNINFAYSGIVILNDKSIKGLEFDVVFIIIDGFKIYKKDLEDSMKKRFYVMSSRAIKKLVMFKSENYNGGVEQILPKDENILKREVLNNG